MAVKKSKLEYSGFEKSLNELEQIVQDLEDGKMSLEDTLVKFETGVELYKNCRGILDQVEKKVKILSDDLKEIDFKLNKET